MGTFFAPSYVNLAVGYHEIKAYSPLELHFGE